jgi:cyanophycinase
VLGEFVYAALEDKESDNDLSSPEVLRDPYFYRVTLVRNFLEIQLLKNTLTDSHFAKRDRLGRSLGFLARIAQNGWSAHPREIAIDEKSALLVEADGSAKVVGPGKGAYFLEVKNAPEVCAQGKPLTIRGVRAYYAGPGASFDVKSWLGRGGNEYEISVLSGRVVESGLPGF